MIIKDEIYGTIVFDGMEERIIDDADFQRLRRIRQMSVTNLVYPGANHTRFEHSLGTAHLSEVIARRIGLGEEDVRKVKLYALLHDIGHVAFSHEGEDVLKRHIGGHEELGRKKMLDGRIADILNESYRRGEIASVGKTSHGRIVDSDLGADRMDYLKRDAANTGVAYGVIDIDRIVHTLRLSRGGLCISGGGLQAAEYLLMARFMMFSTVYLHHTVRIATAMLYRAMEGAIEDGTVAPDDFMGMGDEEAMLRMKRSASGGRYVDALLNRRLYKEVCSFHRGKRKKADSDRLAAKLERMFRKEIIVDYPQPFIGPVDFKVMAEGGQQPISRLSTIVRSLKEAEEQRMKVLVLAEEATRDRHGRRISAAVSEYAQE